MPAQPQAVSLVGDRVRRAVGAEEEVRIARGRGAAQRQPVLLALGDRQAVEMRADAAGEDGVAVDDQMMRGDRRREIRRRSATYCDRLLGGDVLEHDAQFGQPAAQRVEHPVDEHRLAVEDIDLRVGHLAVDQQRHADLRHALEHRHDPVDDR